MSYKQQFNFDSFAKICTIIEKSLKKYTIYDLINIDKIIIYLDYKNRKEVVLSIIKSLIKSNKIYYLDNKDEKLKKLIDLITPLISEIKDNNIEENNSEQIMNEEKINIYLCQLYQFLAIKNRK
jgi:hypothetical protein